MPGAAVQAAARWTRRAMPDTGPVAGLRTLPSISIPPCDRPGANSQVGRGRGHRQLGRRHAPSPRSRSAAHQRHGSDSHHSARPRRGTVHRCQPTGHGLWTTRGTSCELRVDYCGVIHSLAPAPPATTPPPNAVGPPSPAVSGTFPSRCAPPPWPRSTRPPSSTSTGRRSPTDPGCWPTSSRRPTARPPDPTAARDRWAVRPTARSSRPLRAAADIVLAGAGTVRAENYGRARLTDEQQAARQARGRSPLPRLAVVSASLATRPGGAVLHRGRPRRSRRSC